MSSSITSKLVLEDVLLELTSSPRLPGQQAPEILWFLPHQQYTRITDLRCLYLYAGSKDLAQIIMMAITL